MNLKQILTVLMVATALVSAALAQTSHPDAQWFGGAGLGLFLHWGISSVHGNIDLSWGMMADTPWDKDAKDNKVTPAQYFKLAERFNPDKYDPDKWLAAARKAGFRYAVMTARHHDGYAMWPSAYGDFGTRQYLNGRDFVKPFVEACRRNGLKVGLYYSPPDWHYNRQYMSFCYGKTKVCGLNHEPVTLSSEPGGWDKAYAEYVRGQVEELLTRYGKIDVMWFDGGPPVITIERIRELQPGVVINPRMHGHADFKTPEVSSPKERPEGWWELCTIWAQGPWWGYVKSEQYRSTGWMLSEFVRVRAWGGNLLLNIGPRPTGELPGIAYQRFAELEQWMSKNRESVFGTTGGPYPEKSNVPVTVKGNTWYLHALPDFRGVIEVKEGRELHRAKLLASGARLRTARAGGVVRIEIPPAQRTELDDVVALEWR